MVSDKKAEELEAKGLYRRAASRWLEVFDNCESDAAAISVWRSVFVPLCLLTPLEM